MAISTFRLSRMIYLDKGRSLPCDRAHTVIFLAERDTDSRAHFATGADKRYASVCVPLSASFGNAKNREMHERGEPTTILLTPF